MKSLLPRVLLASLLYSLIALLLTSSALAFSYGDYVRVNGSKYSGCYGSGNFGNTNANYYVCDDNACGGGRLTVAPSTGQCSAGGVFFANRGDVSPVGGPPPPPPPPPPPVDCPSLFQVDSCEDPSPVSNFNDCAQVEKKYKCVLLADQPLSNLELRPEGNCAASQVDHQGQGTDGFWRWWGYFGVKKDYAHRSFDVFARGQVGAKTCTSVGLTVTGGSPPCPYTDVRAYFKKGTEPESEDLTVSLNSLVSIFARDQDGHDIPNGRVRYQLVQLTDSFGDDCNPCNATNACDSTLSQDLDVPPNCVADGYNTLQSFTWNFNSAAAAGTHILYAYPVDAAGDDVPTCLDRGIYGTANLTVVGCPYRETSVLIADRDKDPFTFSEEENDQPTFCGYGKDGQCTPTLKTHYQKNLRFKVMRQDRNGQVLDATHDARLLVRRSTSPTTFVQECDATTGGSVASGTCQSGPGFVDYYLDPNNTSLTALQSGGATDDIYTVQATTLVTQNSQTFEIDAPGCSDTDEVQADACLYDSTQAYLRNKFAKPDEFKWTNNLFALRNDTVTFGAFHNFDNPETQSEPPFATDTVGGLTGPYGINPLYGPGKFHANPDERKLDLAGRILNGEYHFDVATNRVKDGNTYKLDKSDFCASQGTLKVSANACINPAPATSLTKCCPTKPEGSTWTLNPLLSTLLLPFRSLPLRLKLGVSRFETTTDTKKIADYFFGRDQEGQVDKGLYFKAVPPYEIVEKFPTETEEIQKRRETAQYSFNLSNQNETELTRGPLENLPAAAFGAERIHKSWAARPLPSETAPPPLPGPLPRVSGLKCGISSQAWQIERYPTAFVDNFRTLGVTNTRFGIDWRNIEPSRNSYSWSRADTAVNTMISNGIEVVGIFDTIPAWVSSNPGWCADDTHTTSCELDKNNPTTVAEFEQFTRDVVARYRGKVRHWEFWNEPDQWTTMRDPANYTFWLNKFYDAAKGADSSIIVAAAAPVGGEIGFMTTVYNLGGRFDALTFHPYGGTRGSAPLEKGKVQALRNLMVSKGDAAKSIWLTEYGFETQPCGVMSYATQSQLLQDALAWIGSQSYITIADLHMLHDLRPPEGPLCLGITKEPELNFAPKEAYTTFSGICNSSATAYAPAATHGNVLGTSTPTCSEIRRTFVTENACFTETEGAETDSAGLTEFLTIAQGGLDNLLNLFADKLDWLEAYVRGGNTTDTRHPDSAAKRDTAYASGGLNKVFLRPGEENAAPPEKAGEAKANLVLGFQYKSGDEWRWIPEARIELPVAQAALRYLGGVKETVDFLRLRTLRPGEELPAEPTPTPSVTPIPPPPPDTIPQNDTSVNIADNRKIEIINFVKSHWPLSPIESEWDYVYNTGRIYGYNPAFVIALWIEESGASGVIPAWDFGCTSAPKNNIPAGLTCMNGLSYKNTPWEEFACRFSEGHYPCTFTINPGFPNAINRYYRCVTQSSCSLF